MMEIDFGSVIFSLYSVKLYQLIETKKEKLLMTSTLSAFYRQSYKPGDSSAHWLPVFGDVTCRFVNK